MYHVFSSDRKIHMVFTKIVYYIQIPFIFLVAQVLEFLKILFSELRYNFRKEI